MFLFLSALMYLSLFLLLGEVFRGALAGAAATKAKAAAQGEADHGRYLLFREQRAADRLLIQQQVAEESRAFERERVAKQEAREARRRLVPDWDQISLLRQQNRISEEEYRAYCFDNTGEYCPAVLVD